MPSRIQTTWAFLICEGNQLWAPQQTINCSLSSTGRTGLQVTKTEITGSIHLSISPCDRAYHVKVKKEIGSSKSSTDKANDDANLAKTKALSGARSGSACAHAVSFYKFSDYTTSLQGTYRAARHDAWDLNSGQRKQPCAQHGDHKPSRNHHDSTAELIIDL